MELPTKEKQKRQILHIRQSSLSVAGETKRTHWNVSNPFQLSLLFAVLPTSQSSVGGPGDTPGHFEQVKYWGFSHHSSDVRALKKRTLLLHALIFFFPDRKLKISNRSGIWSVELIFPCCSSRQLRLDSVNKIKFYIKQTKKQNDRQTKLYNLLYYFFRSSISE